MFLQIDPMLFKPFYCRGTILAAQGKLLEAVSAMRRATILAPSELSITAALGLLRRQMVERGLTEEC